MRPRDLVLLAALSMAVVPQKASLRVHCRDARSAAALRGSLAVEARGAAGGSVVTFGDAPEGEVGFTVHIEADALGNLRAAARSCLSWLQAAETALGAAGTAETEPAETSASDR